MAMLPPGLSQHQQQLSVSQRATRDHAGVPVTQANRAKEVQDEIREKLLANAALAHKVASAGEAATGAALDRRQFTQHELALLLNAEARAGVYPRLPTGGQYVAGLAREVLPVLRSA